MAARTDLLIDLEATLQLRVVESPEWRREAPALPRDLRCMIAVGLRAGRLLGKACAWQREENSERSGEGEARGLHQATSSGFRLAGARAGRPFTCSGPSTGSVMLPGSPRGFSIKPTTGMTTRKKAK